MNYIVANPEQRIYIRIGKNGKPETCSKGEASAFSETKAKNVLANLPKVLKRFNFSIMEDTRYPVKPQNAKEDISIKVLTASPDYEVSPSVKKWINKIRACDDLVREAKQRNEELRQELSRTDKELSNLLHTIEIEGWKNGCEGYKLYKASKIILEKRRPIKDEMLVIHAILETNLSNISEEKFVQIVDGLKNRKFQYRDID